MSERTETALVTGGTRGIGLAVVAALAARGTHVLLGARDGAAGERAAGDLRAAGHRVDAVELDVTDPASIRRVADGLSRLDILVNNAGISGDVAGQRPGSVSLDVVRNVFDTNVFGVVAVTEAMIPLLRRSPAGRVVNVSSGLGSLTRMSDHDDYFTGLPPSVAYAPSKTALNALTVQYAKALRADGILVNAADPGPCATDFTAGVPGVTRTAADGAVVVVRLATLAADGPTGGYADAAGPVPW